ncbi:MAG: 50S ribosomal protein L25, partial [Bradymonadaceae bacterium]
MSEQPTLEVARRDSTGSGPAGRLREDGFVPGVFYGTEVESVPVTVDPDELDDVMEEGNGANTVFEVDV